MAHCRYALVLGNACGSPVLVALGLSVTGATILLAVGFGGCGIALHLGVERGRDPWRVDTVLEAIFAALRGRRPKCLWGLLTHLPQGVAGVLVLALH